jgi:hypothetical protein
MKKPLTAAKCVGRPPTGRPIKRPINVMFDERVAEGLRAYGDDNLSVGVARAAAATAERAGSAPLKALPDLRDGVAGAGAQAKATTKKKGKSKPDRRGPGRPVIGEEPRIRKNVHLYPEMVEQLRMLGDGIVSLGIERAALFVRAVRL